MLVFVMLLACHHDDRETDATGDSDVDDDAWVAEVVPGLRYRVEGRGEVWAETLDGGHETTVTCEYVDADESYPPFFAMSGGHPLGQSFGIKVCAVDDVKDRLTTYDYAHTFAECVATPSWIATFTYDFRGEPRVDVATMPAPSQAEDCWLDVAHHGDDLVTRFQCSNLHEATGEPAEALTLNGTSRCKLSQD